jgi:signal transduction histidine kinase
MEGELALRRTELEALNQSLEVRVEEAVAQLRAKDRILMTQSRQAAMGEMIGNIAHQWRQPLNALSLVLINLEDAHHLHDLDQARFEQALAKGSVLIQKMSSTINDFRDFFRPGKPRTGFSALEQVRATVALVEAAFLDKGIALVIEAPADLALSGLPNELSQVLLNLLSNAKEAIQETGTPHGRITIGLAREDGWGCLSVADNGEGIAEASLERIFEPYFSTRETGTGVGLYMSRQIVEQSLNGRILVRNEAGGAVFTVQLPLEEAGS